jgi:hypothetical protein
MIENNEVNEAIYRAHGWIKLGPPAVPEWQKPGELLFFMRDFANDIFWAWELVEEIVSANYSFKLESLSSVPDNYSMQVRKRGEEYGLIQAQAPNSPLAICKAYLLWKAKK